jgi:ribulose-5-phosphate 4-epimerase/fuculose-1-phosphate aldolase
MVKNGNPQEMRKKLALTCRILYMEGLADYNLGHASSRIPGQERVYIKPQGLGFEEIEPVDLIVIDLENRQLEGDHPSHGENPIHTEIYKLREDVGSIVHVHPFYSTAFSAAQLKFKPLNQDGVVFANGINTFDSPELITTKKQGYKLALTLGQNNAVVLKNHGIVTVGARIEEACLNALFFERALRIQLIASTFGDIEEISDEIALRMQEQCQNPKRYEVLWGYLARKLERNGLGLR